MNYKEFLDQHLDRIKIDLQPHLQTDSRKTFLRSVDENKETIFHSLARCSDLQKIKYILTFFCIDNLFLLKQKNNKGETLLHHLVLNKNLEIIKYVFNFVEKGHPGLFEEKDNNGYTILHILPINNSKIFMYVDLFMRKNYPKITKEYWDEITRKISV